MPKNDFESTNFANFAEVVTNFGGSDDDMISWKNRDVVWYPTWSKNLGLYLLIIPR